MPSMPCSPLRRIKPIFCWPAPMSTAAQENGRKLGTIMHRPSIVPWGPRMSMAEIFRPSGSTPTCMLKLKLDTLRRCMSWATWMLLSTRSSLCSRSTTRLHIRWVMRFVRGCGMAMVSACGRAVVSIGRCQSMPSAASSRVLSCARPMHLRLRRSAFSSRKRLHRLICRVRARVCSERLSLTCTSTKRRGAYSSTMRMKKPGMSCIRLLGELS